MSDKALTPKQEAYCQKYLESGNASDAYRHADEVGNMLPETIKAVAEGRLVDFQSRLGAVFPHAEYERQLTDLRDKLKAGLSEEAADAKDEGPTVAELDASIKALRAANAVQGEVLRIGAKPTRAERPVTARMKPRVAEPVQEEPQPQAEIIPLPVPEPMPELTWESRHRNGRSGGQQLSLF